MGVEHGLFAALDLLGLDVQQRDNPVSQQLLGAVVGVQTDNAGVQVADGASVGSESDGAAYAV